MIITTFPFYKPGEIVQFNGCADAFEEDTGKCAGYLYCVEGTVVGATDTMLIVEVQPCDTTTSDEVRRVLVEPEDVELVAPGRPYRNRAEAAYPDVKIPTENVGPLFASLQHWCEIPANLVHELKKALTTHPELIERRGPARFALTLPGTKEALDLSVYSREPRNSRIRPGSGRAAKEVQIVGYTDKVCGYGGSCMPTGRSAKFARAWIKEVGSAQLEQLTLFARVA